MSQKQFMIASCIMIANDQHIKPYQHSLSPADHRLQNCQGAVCAKDAEEVEGVIPALHRYWNMMEPRNTSDFETMLLSLSLRK